MGSVGGQCCHHLCGWWRFPKEGGSHQGESIVHTKLLVNSGIYGVVRHPQYLGFMLFVLALVLLSQHWLSVLSWIPGSTLFYRDVQREEQMSLEKFGDAYKRYMEQVPRMNLVLGLITVIRRQGLEKGVESYSC